MNEVNKYLVHHGILGQKWGKQNGPPYPLNPANRSSVEKKKNGSNYTDSFTKGSGGGSGTSSLKNMAPEGWIKNFRSDMNEILASNPNFSFGGIEEFKEYLSKNGVDADSFSKDTIESMYKTATDALAAYKALNKTDTTESKSSGKGSGGSSGKGSAKEDKEEQEEKSKEYEKIDSSEWKEKRTKLVDDFYSKFNEVKSKREFPNNINEFARMLYDFDLYKTEDEDGFPSLSDEQLNDLWKEVIRLIDERRAFEREEKKDEVDKMAYRKELQHHGILGQKWGKKNGPPYPLNPANRSSNEKRKNGSKYTESGLAAYKDAKLALGGGGGSINDDKEDDDKEKDELINKIAEMTGMKESAVRDLLALRERTDGKSARYQYDLIGIAEGDSIMAKRIDKAIDSYVQNKKEKSGKDKQTGGTNKGVTDTARGIINEGIQDTANKASKVVTKAKKTYDTARGQINEGIQDSTKTASKVATKAKNIYDDILNTLDIRIKKNSKLSEAAGSASDVGKNIYRVSQQRQIENNKRLNQQISNAITNAQKSGGSDLEALADIFNTIKNSSFLKGASQSEKEAWDLLYKDWEKLQHSEEYELYHSGILGMKWGKRNGPPYPLSRLGKWSIEEIRKNRLKSLKYKTKRENEKAKLYEARAKTEKAKAKIRKAQNEGIVEESNKAVTNSGKPSNQSNNQSNNQLNVKKVEAGKRAFNDYVNDARNLVTLGSSVLQLVQTFDNTRNQLTSSKKRRSADSASKVSTSSLEKMLSDFMSEFGESDSRKLDSILDSSFDEIWAEIRK